MTKKLDLSDLTVASFEVAAPESGYSAALATGFRCTVNTCQIGCTIVTCPEGCETNANGAC